mmetsp:Transcript_61748/g.177782  ORF Transcript_61748/g.177782 Transcript_61748/m.177782 type:complete len:304 (+) Transcript_61748:653-1564(+)
MCAGSTNRCNCCAVEDSSSEPAESLGVSRDEDVLVRSRLWRLSAASCTASGTSSRAPSPTGERRASAASTSQSASCKRKAAGSGSRSPQPRSTAIAINTTILASRSAWSSVGVGSRSGVGGGDCATAAGEERCRERATSHRDLVSPPGTCGEAALLVDDVAEPRVGGANCCGPAAGDTCAVATCACGERLISTWRVALLRCSSGARVETIVWPCTGLLRSSRARAGLGNGAVDGCAVEERTTEAGPEGAGGDIWRRCAAAELLEAALIWCRERLAWRPALVTCAAGALGAGGPADKRGRRVTA